MLTLRFDWLAAMELPPRLVTGFKEICFSLALATRFFEFELSIVSGFLWFSTGRLNPFTGSVACSGTVPRVGLVTSLGGSLCADASGAETF